MTDTTDKMTPFKYVLPQTDRPKKIMWLGRTDRLFATMQVINKGGETNLHSHSHLDGFWFVLGGRGRFYSDETTIACELGPNEGVLVPRGVKYWFESVGDQPLELIQVECSDIAMKTTEALMSDRNDFTPQKRAASGIDALGTADS
jgi:mannose-6-phosphate isomerase-like protein (cupin superfamily)